MNTNRRLSDDELAASLRAAPKVEPPAELLQRLLADLPAAPAAPAPVNDTGGPPRRRSWMPLAASLAVMVGGGLMVLRVVQETPEAPVWTEEREAPTPASAPPQPVLLERVETPPEQAPLPERRGEVAAPAPSTKAEAEHDAPARQGLAEEQSAIERAETAGAPAVEAEKAGRSTVGPRRVSGLVRDAESGAPLPGVTVTASSANLLGKRTVMSGAQGEFSLPPLPAGDYEITAEIDGYQTLVTRVDLEAKEAAKLDFAMPMGVVTEELVVTSSAGESISATSTGSSTMTYERPLPTNRTIAGPAVGAASREQRRLEPVDAAESRAVPKPQAGKIPIPDPAPEQEAFRDVYVEPTIVNPFVASATDPLSTFALEVDTGSWSMARAWLERGTLPPAGAIRVEEALNSYDYGDPAPRRADFALTIEGAPAPWSPFSRTHLVRIGLAARELERGERRPVVLVMLVDVSGSMQQDGRLELVKDALALLLERLRPGDRVGLVTYSDRAQVLLQPTADLENARQAVGRLHPQGSTNAEAGLREAYRMAEGWLGRGSDVRVVLCSDGVANVGATGPDSILESLARWKDRGIELTAVGVGLGNYNDALLEQLANRADGRYAYVDDLDEASRIFGDALDGTLSTLAHEARAQVAFDPRQVERWRLIGYENRAMPDSAFRDDHRDGGEIGFGHRVTALYELVLRDDASRRTPLGEVRLRWRPRGQQEFVEVAEPIRRDDLASSFDRAKPSLRLAAAVAGFAEILRGSPWVGGVGLGQVRHWIDGLPRELSRREDIRRLRDLVTTAQRLGAGGVDDDRPVYGDDEPVGRPRSPVERR